MRSLCRRLRLHPYLMVFVANLLVALVSFCPFILRGKGLFTLCADFNSQELAFNMLCNSAIKSGDVLWNWGLDIGSDLISSMSFYNLGSPFFWLSLIFPASVFPWLIGWIFTLKYAVAGLTSYLFFQRYVSRRSAFLGSMLYAFSGFQCCNLLFYHFHDVVALFPLLVVGLDLLLREKRRGFFLAAVAINALVNYFFFIGEVIFLVLYVLIRFVLCAGKPYFKRFVQVVSACLVEGTLGVGIACVLFFPSIYSVIANPRVSDHMSLADNLVFDASNYLQMLRALFFPAEIMNSMTAVMDWNFYSIALYLPLTGIALVLCYLFSRRHERWLVLMLGLCTLIALCPFANNVFVLFTSEPYRRWYYMFIFFLVFATIQVFDAPDRYPWRHTIAASFVISIGITVYLYLHPDMIRRPSRLALISAVGIGGYCLLFLLFQLLRRNRKWFFRSAALLTAVFCVLTTAMNIEFYYKAFSDTPASSQEVYNEAIGSSQPLSNQLPYRYHFWDVMNRGMPAGLSERSSFTSTVSSSIFTFYDALGIGRHTTSEEGPDGTNELLSVRYYVTLADAPDDSAWMSYSNGSQQVNIYEDTSALPIGFCYDTYMTGSELEAIEPAERAHAMLKTLVVSDEDVDKVSDVLRHYDASVDGEISGESKAADMNRRREACSETFDYGTDFFRSEITSASDQYAFFSVPYDKSWHVTVNGEPVEILKVNGLMAVPVSAGYNFIQFRYSPTPLWIGIGLSIFSLILSLIYVKCRRKASVY